MNHNVSLLIALALPLIVFVGLRVNASMVFLSLSLGEVLVLYVASQANDLIKLFAPHVSPISTSSLQLALLLVPAIVTTIVTALSVHGKIKTVINILPSAAASALAVLLAVPLLPPGLRLALESQNTWKYLSKSEALIVATGALISLLFLWTQRHHFKQREKKHKH